MPLLRPGDVVEQVRVAHFDGQRWSNLGAIDRDPGVSMRPPTEANAPKIAIGPTGNGVVVWQEPDIEGVARIWARRLFGSTLDYVLPVSAETFIGAPISTDADAPSVAVSWLGQADVAYRQNAGPGSPLPGPRIFLNILPNGESKSGGEFEGPIVADDAVPGGQSASVGPPSIDIDEKEDLRLLYDANGTPRVIEGDDKGLTAALSLGPGFVGSEQISVSVMNKQGGGVSAWPSQDAQGAPAVAVREDFPSGAAQTGLVSGGAGGEVGELAVGRSGLGDGLVAFRQGPFGDAAIVAAQVTAPPTELVMSVPKGWIKPSQATITWQPAVSADGPLRYSVVLDGRALPAPAGASSLRLDPLGLGAGRHRVQLLATDINGQSTLSSPSPLAIAGPPSVSIARARGGHGVSVRVSDAYSAVDAHDVIVSFGDGHSARGHRRFEHRYAHGGVYRVVVRVRDKLGERGCRQPLGEACDEATRRSSSTSLVGARCWRPPGARPGPMSSGRSRSSRRDRSAVKPSRPNTRTTRRSRATAGTSPSTARSGGSPACGGGICKPARSNRSRAGTPSCPRSAQTGSTSASRPTKASACRKSAKAGRTRVRIRNRSTCTCATWPSSRRPPRPKKPLVRRANGRSRSSRP